MARKLQATSKKRVLVIVAKFNDMITRCLLNGCEDLLKESEYADSYQVVWVPGCFEIPAVAARAAATGDYDGIITLGAVIRGETPHFDFVAGECARGVMDISVQYKLPVIFGVLTTNTVEQALNRSGIKYGNKGRDAALALLDACKIMAQFPGEG